VRGVSDALADLATAAGLLPVWEDVDGGPHDVAPDTLRAALAALDLPADSATDIADSRERLRAEADRDFVTGDAGKPIAGWSGRGRLTLEGGGTRDIAAGEALVVGQPGYHRIEADGRDVTLAIAPPVAPGVAALTGRPRGWGLAAQLYSLRGDRAAGFGDFAALADMVRVAGAHGADALAISPVHALFLADPTRFSPYSPSSRDFLNPLFAYPGVGEEADSDALIDWPAASAARVARLRGAFAAFDGDPAFDAFVTAGGDPLRGHALFEALHAHFHAQGDVGGWQAWPDAFHDPEGIAVARFAADHARDIRFHLFLQWRATLGLSDAQAAARGAGMAIGLVADLAVGIDPGGSHAWSRRGELLHGLTLGAPPDTFQAAGQGWGITGLSPTALARTGYEPFLRTVRAALAHAGGLRVDHALGLGRLWVIPEGAAPLDGVYLRQPIDDLLRLLTLEAHRARAIVIGEDLGVVPPGFRDRLADRHLLGMRVLPFERTEEGGFTDPQDWSPVAAAMTSTHDLTPFAGWWRGIDIGWRETLGAEADTPDQRDADRDRFWDRATASGEATGTVPPAEAPAAAVDAAIALVARAGCELALVALEDLVGLEQAPNLPGTIDEHPNWRRRLPATPATLFADDAVAARLATLAKERPA
jgi:4-alpha-glucanotransferase